MNGQFWSGFSLEIIWSATVTIQIPDLWHGEKKTLSSIQIMETSPVCEWLVFRPWSEYQTLSRKNIWQGGSIIVLFYSHYLSSELAQYSNDGSKFGLWIFAFKAMIWIPDNLPLNYQTLGSSLWLIYALSLIVKLLT